jgi:ribosomal protein L37AE/L43A
MEHCIRHNTTYGFGFSCPACTAENKQLETHSKCPSCGREHVSTKGTEVIRCGYCTHAYKPAEHKMDCEASHVPTPIERVLASRSDDFEVMHKGRTPSALGAQVGGGHYKDMPIQPFEFIHKNGIGFAEGCAIKYLSRWRKKGGVEDLKKARHFIDLLIEQEAGAA